MPALPPPNWNLTSEDDHPTQPWYTYFKSLDDFTRETDASLTSLETSVAALSTSMAPTTYFDAQILAAKPITYYTVAASNETSNINTGANKVRVRMPFAFNVTEVRGALSVAQSAGSVLTVDVNRNTTSIFSTRITFDNGEQTSVTAVTPAVLATTSFADDDEVEVDVDQVGTAGARGLKITLIGRRA